MYHTLPTRDYLDLSYRDDVCFIINRILRPLAKREVKVAFQATLAAARQHECRHWLIDLRRDTHYRPELLTTFFPSETESSGAITYLAYLVSPMLLTEMHDHGDVPLPEHYDNLPFRARLFVDEQAAQDWLSNK